MGALRGAEAPLFHGAPWLKVLLVFTVLPESKYSLARGVTRMLLMFVVVEGFPEADPDVE